MHSIYIVSKCLCVSSNKGNKKSWIKRLGNFLCLLTFQWSIICAAHFIIENAYYNKNILTNLNFWNSLKQTIRPKCVFNSLQFSTQDYTVALSGSWFLGDSLNPLLKPSSRLSPTLFAFLLFFVLTLFRHLSLRRRTARQPASQHLTTGCGLGLLGVKGQICQL